MLIELIDGGIKDIQTDREHYDGCETCDWGSEYINEFTVCLTRGNVKFIINQMYDYAVSEDYLMKLFILNILDIQKMTEQQFYEWISAKLKSDFGNTLKVESSLT